MSNVLKFDDATKLAEAAAKLAVVILNDAINTNGSAIWVLAGGSTPLLGYKFIAANHHNELDWTKVTLVMGDERIGPLDGPENNWHAINQILGGLPTTKLRPQSDRSAEDAAADYEQQLASLPKSDSNMPRFDLVWLGVGPDGHTLSLFPLHSSILPTGGVVIAMHDSPKPPSDRISLTLRGLQGTTNAMILAAGADKQQAMTDSINGSYTPIGIAASIITTHDGKVTWLVDKDAAPSN